MTDEGPVSTRVQFPDCSGSPPCHCREHVRNGRKPHRQNGKSPRPPRQRVAKRNARKEKQRQIRFCTPSVLRTIECGGVILHGTGPAQGRRGFRSRPDRFARLPSHEQEGQMALLFVKTVFSSTGRGAFSFVRTKENGGRIPAGETPARAGPCRPRQKTTTTALQKAAKTGRMSP